eukprot:SAG11_NODE_151_length_14583_cov_21.306200_3_plen_103_part_00
MKGIVIEPLVYCLKLENDKYYVGITYNLNLRYAQHEAGEGARWTRRHKPIEVIEVFMHGSEELENAKTKEYMLKYGWENLRGGYWCKVDYKSPPAMLTEDDQ